MNFKKEYSKSWSYLKKNEFYFLFIFLVFLFAVFLGYFFPVFFIDMIVKFVTELAEKTKDMNFWQLLFFILQNNLTSAFLGVILGVALGIMPVLFSFFNGYILGFVSVKTVEATNASVLLRLLPHGIFEIPALIISLGLGLKLGTFIFAKTKKKVFLHDLENALRVFLYVVIPLLLIAGVIETSLIFLLG